MILLLAVTVVAALVTPHIVRLDDHSPGAAAMVWLAALVLRALTAIFAAVFVVLYLPTTALFTLITHWCWHAVIPFIAAHLPVSGHTFGDAALVAPTLALAISATSVTVGLLRAARRVRLLLDRGVVGAGPRESLLLAGSDIFVAAAGLRRPRVVISAGALLSFDDEELAASLEHEHGHIARRHRWALVVAELCRGLARFIPGTQSAHRELSFWLERDADRYALDRAQNPQALASAICKAAGASPLRAPALALGGGTVSRRVRLLLDGDQRVGPASLRTRLLACTMVTLTLAGIAAVPSAAHAGLHEAAGVPAAHSCPA